MQASEISLWFDGACEPVNPGGVATGGWIVKDQSGNVLLQGHRMICRGDSATNNIAEYGALIGGLRAIQEQLPNVRIVCEARHCVRERNPRRWVIGLRKLAIELIRMFGGAPPVVDHRLPQAPLV